MAHVDLQELDAPRLVTHIDDCRERVCQTLVRISDTQQQMLRSGWHGRAAAGYEVNSERAADDYRRCIAYLVDICEKAKQNITEVSAEQQNA